MATTDPISALTALGAAPATGDLLVLVDVSDPTQASSGTTKKMTVANLFTAPTLTGAVQMTGTLGLAGALAINTNKVMIDGTTGNTLIAGSLGISGLVTVNDGLSINGPATLGATAASLFSFETPITRFYVGDGSGFSFRHAKRTGSVTTDLITIADSGTTFTVGTGGASVAGGVLIPSGSLGYSTGAGGAVTQATNRTTGVTLNTPTGRITTNSTSIAASSVATFTVTNSSVAATDTVILSWSSAALASTIASVTAVAAGSFNITINNTNASTAENGTMLINFAVIKAVNA